MVKVPYCLAYEIWVQSQADVDRAMSTHNHLVRGKRRRKGEPIAYEMGRRGGFVRVGHFAKERA